MVTFGELPEDVVVKHEAEGAYDHVLLFVHNIGELKEYAPAVIKTNKFDCVMWVAYPKRSAGIQTDINRDTGWEVMERSRLRPVTQVAIDTTWSAKGFRPIDRIGK